MSEIVGSLIFVTLLVALLVGLARDIRRTNVRGNAICVSAFHQAHTSRDSLAIAVLNERCSEMLKDSIQ